MPASKTTPAHGERNGRGHNGKVPATGAIQYGGSVNSRARARWEYVHNHRLRVMDGPRIKVSGIGALKLREELRWPDRKVMGGRIYRDGKRWFLSLQFDLGDEYHREEPSSEDAVGVDLGISKLATLSTGDVIAGSKPLRTALKKLRRLGRRASRQTKGSARWKRTQERIGILQRRVANIRADNTHKMTTRLCREFREIAIEDLNVSGMVNNKRLAKDITDGSFFEIRRQLEYKSALHGNTLHVIDRWFPSSKTCSGCGHKKENLSLSTRTYTCEVCGMIMDRDENAARNIRDASTKEAA